MDHRSWIPENSAHTLRLGIEVTPSTVRMITSSGRRAAVRWAGGIPAGASFREDTDCSSALCRAIAPHLIIRGGRFDCIGITSAAGRSPTAGWVDVDRLQGLLASRLSLPVRLRDATTSAARAEFEAGADRPHSLLFIRIGVTIDTALVVGGAVHPGLAGSMPALAHSPFADPHLHCRCGRHGCLEAAASLTRLHTALPPTGPTSIPHQAFDEPRARAIIDESGRAIGRALAAAANLLNPGTIVVAGLPARVQAQLLQVAQEAFDEHPLTTDAKRIRIQRPQFGHWVFAAGAALAASDVDSASTFPGSR